MLAMEKGEGAGGAGTANLNPFSSSSSSSSAEVCDAMTLAKRWAATLAAAFCVRLTVENPVAPAASRDCGCAGDIAGDDEPVLEFEPLHCREYTGLTGLLRSISYICTNIHVCIYLYICVWERERVWEWKPRFSRR